MVSWLACSTPDRVFLVRALVLCSWAGHFTFTLPLFTQGYKWVSTILLEKLKKQTHFDNIATFFFSVLSSGMNAFQGKERENSGAGVDGKNRTTTLSRSNEWGAYEGGLLSIFGYLCSLGTRQANVVPPRDMVFISTCLMWIRSESSSEAG